MGFIAICHHCNMPSQRALLCKQKKGKHVAPTRRMDIVMSTRVARTRRMDISTSSRRRDGWTLRCPPVSRLLDIGFARVLRSAEGNVSEFLKSSDLFSGQSRKSEPWPCRPSWPSWLSSGQLMLPGPKQRLPLSWPSWTSSLALLGPALRPATASRGDLQLSLLLA